jgi:hypothetical protein
MLIVIIVLHPQYKLEYFRTANWEQEWIDTAEDLLRTQFQNKYEEFDEVSPPSNGRTSSPSSLVSFCTFVTVQF